MEMKLTGTPEEIEKLLNAIGGSKEQSKKINDMSEKITNLQNKLVMNLKKWDTTLIKSALN